MIHRVALIAALAIMTACTRPSDEASELAWVQLSKEYPSRDTVDQTGTIRTLGVDDFTCVYISTGRERPLVVAVIQPVTVKINDNGDIEMSDGRVVSNGDRVAFNVFNRPFDKADETRAVEAVKLVKENCAESEQVSVLPIVRN